VKSGVGYGEVVVLERRKFLTEVDAYLGIPTRTVNCCACILTTAVSLPRDDRTRASCRVRPILTMTTAPVFQGRLPKRNPVRMLVAEEELADRSISYACLRVPVRG